MAYGSWLSFARKRGARRACQLPPTEERRLTIARAFLSICILVLAYSILFSESCDQQDSPQRDAEEEWNDLLSGRVDNGLYDLLSIEESRRWIAENGDITALQKAELGILIEIDPNGNLRVFKFRTYDEDLTSMGFMTPEASTDWLKQKGYKASRDENGYVLERDEIKRSEGVDITIKSRAQISAGTIIDGDNTIITTDSEGRARVKK